MQIRHPGLPSSLDTIQKDTPSGGSGTSQWVVKKVRMSGAAVENDGKPRPEWQLPSVAEFCGWDPLARGGMEGSNGSCCKSLAWSQGLAWETAG